MNTWLVWLALAALQAQMAVLFVLAAAALVAWSASEKERQAADTARQQHDADVGARLVDIVNVVDEARAAVEAFKARQQPPPVVVRPRLSRKTH